MTIILNSSTSLPATPGSDELAANENVTLTPIIQAQTVFFSGGSQ
jgi:hypothetical protein